MDWLTTTLIAAVVSTLLYWLSRGRFKLGLLSLMLWGATVMILVDHILGYEGGPFFEAQTDGLIKNGAVLGIVMLLPVILFWLGAILLNRRR
ncbi:MAG: hypothetical protein K6T77_02830 [candidate division WOR-3 bacterium]|jgi:hypothetical protein|nr:hypothetical protein [candidate division WOR-3 bacterium]MCR4424557.1 hypothetical protein [candidate division WOR-3 bacterium]MDH7519323.1 hypothetical protein [bacterium]